MCQFLPEPRPKATSMGQLAQILTNWPIALI